MSKYVPTDDEVETAFHEYASMIESETAGEYPEAPEFRDWKQALAGYRRWLEQHDREVREKAESDLLDRLLDDFFYGGKNRYFLTPSTVAWIRDQPEYARRYPHSEGAQWDQRCEPSVGLVPITSWGDDFG